MAITTTRYAIFNGYNLNSVPGCSVYAITPPGSGNNTLNIFPLARRDARKVSSTFFDSNKITLGVYITANTRELLEAAMDTLLANIQAVEGTLVIPRSGGTARAYTATFDGPFRVNNALSNTDSPSGNYVDLTLVFECSDSFGYDQFFTPMFTTGALTSSPNTWNWTFTGSAATQAPFLQFYFTGGTLGSGTVIVGNQSTGQQISVNRTWAAGDTLQIDVRNKTVQVVNGFGANDVTFTGAFPTFGLGLQTISYSDSFTSRTYRFYAYVYVRYV